MSVRCISKVLDDSVHTGTDLLMLIILADYSDDDGNSYPAVASLARKCRTSPRHANRILASLRDSGELEIRQNEGPRGTNRYRIMLRALGASKAAQAFEPLTQASALTHASPLTQVPSLTGASSLTPTSGTPDAHVPKPLTPMSDEPSLNRQDPSKGFPGFDRFWATWPPSNRKGAKSKCLDMWKKAHGERDAEMVIAHVEALKASAGWAKNGGEFIPAPLVYLNQRRWEGSDLADGAASNDPWAGAIN